MTTTQKASRGEIWLVNLDPTVGHEQQGTRPCLVVSADPLNHGPAQPCIALPITTTDRGIPSHVRIDPPAGGLRQTGIALCEAVGSLSTQRLHQRWGAVRPETLKEVERVLRFLLDL